MKGVTSSSASTTCTTGDMKGGEGDPESETIGGDPGCRGLFGYDDDIERNNACAIREIGNWNAAAKDSNATDQINTNDFAMRQRGRRRCRMKCHSQRIFNFSYSPVTSQGMTMMIVSVFLISLVASHIGSALGK